MGAKGQKESIDCSGAVCKVLKKLGVDRGDPTYSNSAQHFHNDSKAVKPGEEKDGDLITFNFEGKKIDHIGFLVIDKNTGEKYIAESSSSYNRGTITPFNERIAYLQDKAKTEHNNVLKYYIRRLKS